MTVEGEGVPSVRIDVRRGSPNEDELAALLAVVTEAYSGEASEAVAPDDRPRSAWSLTQRNLRSPLNRDLGWRGVG